MSHMVIFRGADGKAGYHQADALDEAVRFVERVRNEEGVDAAHIFRLQEVPFEFRQYFRVELRPPDGSPGDDADPGDGADAAADAAAHPAPVPVDGDVPANGGRKGIFTR